MVSAFDKNSSEKHCLCIEKWIKVFIYLIGYQVNSLLNFMCQSFSKHRLYKFPLIYHNIIP